ncbi:unnamed protein product, partial [Vitis vinifera]
MGVNNKYNSHIVFDGKTKRCTTYYKLRSQITLSFLCLFLSTYTTQPPVTSILADTFLFWAVKVGNRRNILVVSFWVMSAAVVSLFHHFDLLVQNCHHSIDVSERGEERVDYIPNFLQPAWQTFQYYFTITTQSWLELTVIFMVAQSPISSPLFRL